MSELKKFLNPMTSFQRLAYPLILVLCAGIVFLFIMISFSSGIALELMIMPAGLFIAFGVLVSWMFRRSLHAYDNWWNSLSDVERAEIEQDFRNASQDSYYLITGTRYAFIRNTGCVLPYENFDYVELIPGKKGRCYMNIHVIKGKKIFVDLPSFSEGEQLHHDLRIHCNFSESEEQ